MKTLFLTLIFASSFAQAINGPVMCRNEDKENSVSNIFAFDGTQLMGVCQRPYDAKNINSNLDICGEDMFAMTQWSSAGSAEFQSSKTNTIFSVKFQFWKGTVDLDQDYEVNTFAGKTRISLKAGSYSVKCEPAS